MQAAGGAAFRQQERLSCPQTLLRAAFLVAAVAVAAAEAWVLAVLVVGYHLAGCGWILAGFCVPWSVVALQTSTSILASTDFFPLYPSHRVYCSA